MRNRLSLGPLQKAGALDATPVTRGVGVSFTEWYFSYERGTPVHGVGRELQGYYIRNGVSLMSEILLYMGGASYRGTSPIRK